jgi:cytosine/adenosine deaminase-related metal-dependent hydrolase
MARPTNEQRILIAQRRTRVLAMRTEQVPYSEIAAREDITESTARDDYARARKQAAVDLAATVTEHRAAELLKIDALEREAWRVLKARHITVQHGKIVRDENDQPIEDDAPVLQAIDRLERLMKRRAAMLGLDAPVKVEVSAEVDEQITALAAALAGGVGELEPAGEAAPAGDAEAG